MAAYFYGVEVVNWNDGFMVPSFTIKAGALLWTLLKLFNRNYLLSRLYCIYSEVWYEWNNENTGKYALTSSHSLFTAFLYR